MEFPLLSLLLLLVVFPTCCLLSSPQDVTAQNKFVMPWMCLELCNQSSADIQEQLTYLKQNADIIKYISFEKYTLCANHSLCREPVQDIASSLQALSLKLLPMISSYPYPTDFLDRMRAVFDDPAPFVQGAINEALTNRYAGWNVDWEPTTTPTATDGKQYAMFLDYFAKQLHQHGLVLSVDIGSWSSIWDWNLIAASEVDYVMVMSTYATSNATFLAKLKDSVATFAPQKLVSGLCSSCATPPLAEADIQYRFDLLEQYQVQHIGIWDMPLDSTWTHYVRKFMTDNRIQ